MSSRLLPAHLRPIFFQVSSLQSLDNLLKVSPSALRHFNEHGADIFESVLCSKQASVHDHTRALIRIAALVRSSSLPSAVRSWGSFRDFVRHESTSHRYEPPAWTLPPTRLSPAVPASILVGILATQQKIECLVTGCLEFYLKRFRALQPLHPANPSFKFKPGELGPNGHYIGPWEQWPDEEPFPVRDIGPPTWIEEQRVLRAFWRVQLFQDLKAAASDSLLDWPGADLENLERMTVVDLHEPIFKNRYDNSESDHWLVIDEDTEPNPYQQDTLLEHELVWSVSNYTTEDAQAIASLDFLQTKRNWPAAIATDTEWEDLSYHTSPTHYFFHQIQGDSNGHSHASRSPLQHVSFKHFRRFGFAIWSTERMFGYGLLQPPWDEDRKGDENKPFTEDSLMSAWRSILGKDELAEVAKENKNRIDGKWEWPPTYIRGTE